MLKKLIKILIGIGEIFFLDIVWLVTIMIAAPNDAIKAKIIPSIFKSSVEGLNARNNPINVVKNKNLITFFIFSLVIKIDIDKTKIG